MCMQDIEIGKASTVITRTLPVQIGANVDIFGYNPERIAVLISLSNGTGQIVPEAKAAEVFNGHALTQGDKPYEATVALHYGLPMKPHSFIDSGVGSTLVITEVFLTRDVK